MIDIVAKTKTLNPAFKGGAGALVVGKSSMPVDTLHGKYDSEKAKLLDKKIAQIQKQASNANFATGEAESVEC